MKDPIWKILPVFLLVSLLIGTALSWSSSGKVVRKADDGKLIPRVDISEFSYRGLDANLYMQSSAEYRAACLQAFNLAEMQLAQAVKASPKTEKKPAVILDLDETVLDNAVFQARQTRDNASYDQKVWDEYEQKDGDLVTLIPGAKEFLVAAKRMGVTPVYISNRNDKSRETTKAILKRLGLGISSEDELELAKETSDKTKRRATIESKFTVLMLLGDNLRDFDEQFNIGKFDPKDTKSIATALAARKRKVDQEKSRFGSRWIILPNPAYGEWTKPFGKGTADLDYLVPNQR
jgi:5'-nucleotidase (lipoprotein e(P4) family)